MGKNINEWTEHFKKKSIEQLKEIYTALVTLKKDDWLDKEYFDGVGLCSIMIIVRGELRIKANKQYRENRFKKSVQQLAKHYPKPDYCKCNKGHTLVEVFKEKKNAYEWDCPICINAMEKERMGGLKC